MPISKKLHKVTVHGLRKAERVLAKAGEPRLIDYVVATCILAKREQMSKDELGALVGEVFDDLEG